MATVRAHVQIAADPDTVWKVVRDTGSLADWLPAATGSRMEGNVRVVEVGPDSVVRETITVLDDDLRRLQYEIFEGLPLTGHRATIDVIGVADGTLVIYGTDLEPVDMAEAFTGILTDGVNGLKKHIEG